MRLRHARLFMAPVAIALVCLSLAGVVHSASAAVTPAAVSAVGVHGTLTPSEVVISWAAPVDPNYAGARVVVVPGSVATFDAADPAAVFAQDVAAPASSLTWSAGTAGQSYAISVFAFDASKTAFATAIASPVALPGPVRHLSMSASHGSTRADYVLPANADEAVMCESPSSPPTAPATAFACGVSSTYGAYFPDERGTLGSFNGVDAKRAMAVFSFNSATGIYGPGVSQNDGQLAPSMPSYLTVRTSGAQAGVVDIANFNDDFGHVLGTVGWEALWVAGTRSPLNDAKAERTTIAESTAITTLRPGETYTESHRYLRLTGLIPDVPYTFVARGVDAEGNGSPWTPPRTFAVGTHGTFLLDNSGPPGARWLTSRVPGASPDVRASLAPEPGGLVHVSNDAPTLPRRVNQVRGPGGAWRRGALPAGALGLRLSASRSADGVIAATNAGCVYLESRGRWGKVGCLVVPPQGTGRTWGATQVLDAELDKRGAVHVVFTGYEHGGLPEKQRRVLLYGSNASGTWTIRKIRDVEFNTATALTYDPVIDELVLAVGAPDHTGHYRLGVTSKPARAIGFAPLPTRFDVPADHALVPSSIASYGGRITIAVRRLVIDRITDYTYVPAKAWGPAALLTGSRPGNVGGLSDLPGGARVTGPLLFATSKTEVLVGWNHIGFSINEQGIWTARRSYQPAGAITSRRVRQTRSAYDVLDALSVDRSGHVYILYRRRDGNTQPSGVNFDPSYS